jgi:hypothetical protein
MAMLLALAVEYESACVKPYQNRWDREHASD